MDEIKKMLVQPVIKDGSGSTVVNVGHVLALSVGALVLYYAIPERKRKNLFK